MLKRTLNALCLLSVIVGGAAIYPEGHFDHVHRVTTDNFDSLVKESVDADKTLFAPAWNTVAEQFAGSPDVVFGDINLQEQQIRGTHSPGAGGWPTIKYFNKETGYQGAPYKQKTAKSMCDELGPGETYMQQYVEEAGKTSLCDVLAGGKGCSEKQMTFYGKWKDRPAEAVAEELKRLDAMGTGSMKSDLKLWRNQRLSVLRKLSPASGSDEL